MRENAFSRAAQTLGRARWKGMTSEEISAHQKKIASMPRTAKRCFCGATSMTKAADRYFDCCRKAGVVTLNFERRKELKKDEQRRREDEAVMERMAEHMADTIRKRTQ